ncbi:MAG: hypothetical protein ABI603_01720 [Acidobacteriota bacterium]
MAETTIDFNISAGLPTALMVDLTRVLGRCELQRDWRGRLSFQFPEPFADLWIRQHEDLTTPAQAAKRARLLLAIEFFTLREG